MSYILDALRRADAERERGRVPGLHSQVSPGGAAPRTSAPRRGRTRPKAWTVSAGALLLLGAAWLAYQNTRPDAASPSPGASLGASGPVTQADATPNPAPNTAPGPAPSADPAPPAAAAVVQAPEPIRPILAPAPPAPKPVAQAAPAPAPAPAPAAAATPAPTPSPSAAPAADANVIRLADLSPEARAQIPPLQVSGSTYSDNPALRMLIINGKVVQEGQDIAPGLKLESIGLRTAIVNHRGQRLRISH